MDAETIYSNSFQDPLENLSTERFGRVCELAAQYNGSSKSELYQMVINDKIICAIDEKIVNVLSGAFSTLRAV